MPMISPSQTATAAHIVFENCVMACLPQLFLYKRFRTLKQSAGIYSGTWLLKSEDNGSGEMAAHVGGVSVSGVVTAKIYEVEKETAGWFARRSPSLALTVPGVANTQTTDERMILSKGV
ncbi:hypothetical protein TNCV_2603951 [Trichonephila clavipes]|nr:hypothetical protein TNCV_2603951 [Trichonephila clavipes]